MLRNFALSVCALGGLVAACNSGPPAQPVVPEPAPPAIRAVPIQADVKPDIFKMPANSVTTGSGLKYEVEVEGTGVQPKAGQVVTIHFTGWLTNGTKFDSSKERNPPAPATFVLGEGHVMAGWDEGIALMKVGGQSWFIVPPHLGYGARTSGLIPPNSTLVCRLELLEVR